MPRRVITVRIDAKIDAPFTRQFDFDPIAVVCARRYEMVCAALTLIRGQLLAAESGQIGSFEDWGRLVAKTVAYVGNTPDLGDGQFSDPTSLLVQAHTSDPTRELLMDLLAALRDHFGTEWFKARNILEVISRSGSGYQNLADAFEGIVHGKLTKQSIGSILRNRHGQIVNGLCLDLYEDARNGNRYRVRDQSDEDGVVVKGKFAEGREWADRAIKHLPKS